MDLTRRFGLLGNSDSLGSFVVQMLELQLGTSEKYVIYGGFWRLIDKTDLAVAGKAFASSLQASL